MMPFEGRRTDRQEDTERQGFKDSAAKNRVTMYVYRDIATDSAKVLV